MPDWVRSRTRGFSHHIQGGPLVVPGIVLTRPEVSRLLLLKHGLFSPAALTCVEVLQHCLAVQAQYLSAAADAIALRSSVLSTSDLRTDLAPGGPLVRGWSLRGAMHLARAEDWPLLVGAVGPFQYREFQRFMARSKGIPPEELERLEGEILAALRPHPLSRTELHVRMPKLAEIPGASWGSDVKGLVLRGEVLAGISETGDNLFYLAPRALPQASGSQAECLAGRYLRAYGPVDARDFAHWAGIPRRSALEAFAALEENAVTVRLAAAERTLFMAHEDLETIDKGSEIAGDCLLAKFDPLLVAYAGGSPVVAPEYQSRVYQQAGQIEGCVVLDGEAVGTWRAQRARGGLRVQVEGFAPLTRARKDRVEALAASLAAKRRCRLGDLVMVDAGSENGG